MDAEALTKKSENLANRMNKLTEKFSENLDNAGELELTGDDIVGYVEEKTKDITLYSDEDYAAELINLENMVDDFKFVRETLRESSENGRRVLNSVTLELLDSDDEKRATLILSFAELNKAVALNMKLYISAYKEISNNLLNLDKLRSNEAQGPQTVNNTINLNGAEAISTVDMIKRLSAGK